MLLLYLAFPCSVRSSSKYADTEIAKVASLYLRFGGSFVIVTQYLKSREFKHQVAASIDVYFRVPQQRVKEHIKPNAPTSMIFRISIHLNVYYTFFAR